jgi:hypothetical protein
MRRAAYAKQAGPHLGVLRARQEAVGGARMLHIVAQRRQKQR